MAIREIAQKCHPIFQSIIPSLEYTIKVLLILEIHFCNLHACRLSIIAIVVEICPSEEAISFHFAAYHSGDRLDNDARLEGPQEDSKIVASPDFTESLKCQKQALFLCPKSAETNMGIRDSEVLEIVVW